MFFGTGATSGTGIIPDTGSTFGTGITVGGAGDAPEKAAEVSGQELVSSYSTWRFWTRFKASGKVSFPRFGIGRWREPRGLEGKWHSGKCSTGRRGGNSLANLVLWAGCHGRSEGNSGQHRDDNGLEQHVE